MNNSVYILKDRAILYVNGQDARDFLQNLISNDINKVTDNSSCFASLLTPQGKFLYEFIIVKHKSGFFIDCEKSQSEEILKQLNLYKIRSKVEILNLSNEFVVASFGYEKYLSIDDSKDILGFTMRYREDPIVLDPRNKNLGARLIISLAPKCLFLGSKKIGSSLYLKVKPNISFAPSIDKYFSYPKLATTNSLLKLRISTFDLILYKFNCLNISSD